MYRDKQCLNKIMMHDNKMLYGLEITPMNTCGTLYDKYETIISDCPIISSVFIPGTSTRQKKEYVYSDNLYILNRYIREIKEYVVLNYIGKNAVTDEERFQIEDDVDGYIHTKFRIETAERLDVYHASKLTSVSSVLNYDPFVYADTDQVYFRYFASQLITMVSEVQRSAIVFVLAIHANVITSDVIGEHETEVIQSFVLKLNHILTSILDIMQAHLYDIKHIEELNHIVDAAMLLNGLYLYTGR